MSKGHGPMASMVTQIYSGGLGAEPLLRGQGGKAPLKLKQLVFGFLM